MTTNPDHPRYASALSATLVARFKRALRRSALPLNKVAARLKLARTTLYRAVWGGGRVTRSTRAAIASFASSMLRRVMR